MERLGRPCGWRGSEKKPLGGSTYAETTTEASPPVVDATGVSEPKRPAANASSISRHGAFTCAVNFDRSSSTAQLAMTKAQDRVALSLKRLTTGLRINDGRDDPSGLIASESFKSNDAALEQGIENATRASNMVGTAEGALAEVGSLLTGLQSLVASVANSGAQTQDERDAAQGEVDSTISQINKIAGSSSFNGKKLLDGSLSYKTTGVVAASMTNVNVNAAKVPPGGAKAITMAVQTAATRGTITYAGGTLAVGNNVSLELTGNTGTQQMSFAAGTTIAQQAAAINATTNDTGVQATVVGANLQIESADYGSQQAVSARLLSGTYSTSVTAASGTDAVVRVNGALAAANGVNVAYRDNATDVSFSLTATSNVAAQTSTFNVTGGGADFQIGSKVTEANRATHPPTSAPAGGAVRFRGRRAAAAAGARPAQHDPLNATPRRPRRQRAVDRRMRCSTPLVRSNGLMLNRLSDAQ